MNPIMFSKPASMPNLRAALTPAGLQQPVSAPGQTTDRAEQTGGGRNVARKPDYDTYECQTCKNRKYKDGSDDPGVSFKTAAHLDPEDAPYAIRAHEGEHVAHNKAKAAREDREIVSQTVTYHMDICPECGKAYMSGGTTRTVSKASPKQDFGQGNAVQKGVYLDLIA